MSKKNGWIALHRQIQDHWVWQNPETGYAWVDLMLLANHETSKAMYKGTVVTFERGTVNRSISWLARKWGWGRERTSNFLHALEADGMIAMYRAGNRTILTLVNYDKFQNPPSMNHAKNPPKNRQFTEQRTDSSPDTYNNDNNDNNDNNAPDGAHITESEPEEVNEEEPKEPVEHYTADPGHVEDLMAQLRKRMGGE